MPPPWLPVAQLHLARLRFLAARLVRGPLTPRPSHQQDQLHPRYLVARSDQELSNPHLADPSHPPRLALLADQSRPQDQAQSNPHQPILAGLQVPAALPPPLYRSRLESLEGLERRWVLAHLLDLQVRQHLENLVGLRVPDHLAGQPLRPDQQDLWVRRHQC